MYWTCGSDARRALDLLPAKLHLARARGRGAELARAARVWSAERVLNS